MNDQWAWTMEWGLTEGVKGGLSGGGQRGKYWDSCKIINNKRPSNKKKRPFYSVNNMN